MHTVKAFGIGGTGARGSGVAREVCWKRPDTGWIALNVDGSALTNPGAAGFGGIIRNHEGRFMLGFSGSVGWSNILYAELMGLLKGMLLCWEEGY